MNEPRRTMLYHYTSMCRAVQIIGSGNLRFSQLNRVNDINERYRMVYGNPDSVSAQIKDELEHYRQLSLSIDGKRPGYAIPAMWGHYGDSGQGVCLAFDERALLDKLPAKTPNHRVIYKGEYYSDPDNSIIFDKTTNIKAFFEDNINKIFFKKTNDWRYEQEYRIISRADDKNQPCYVPIKDALRAIIIFMPKDTSDSNGAFNSCAVKALKRLVPEIPILEMGNFLNDFGLRDSNGNKWVKNNHEFVIVSELEPINPDV